MDDLLVADEPAEPGVLGADERDRGGGDHHEREHLGADPAREHHGVPSSAGRGVSVVGSGSGAMGSEWPACGSTSM